MGHKGHWGEYTGNAKWSRDHAHTKVTKENYKASERDDAAHIDYLKRDVKDDQKFHVKDKDEKQTADEKHISKLAGDMKYDKEHHGSPAKNKVEGLSHDQLQDKSAKGYKRHMEMHGSTRSPVPHVNKFMDKNHPHNKRKDHDESIHSHKTKKPSPNRFTGAVTADVGGLAHKINEGIPRVLDGVSTVLGGGLGAMAVKGAVGKGIGQTIKTGAKQLLKNASKQLISKFKK